MFESFDTLPAFASARGTQASAQQIPAKYYSLPTALS